jgi:hypothetical protein
MSQLHRWQTEIAGSWAYKNCQGKCDRKNYNESKVVFSSQNLPELSAKDHGLLIAYPRSFQ